MILTKSKKTGTYKAQFDTSHGRRSVDTKATTRPEARQVARNSHLAELEAAARTGQISSQVITQILAGSNVTTASAIEQYARHMEQISMSPSTIHTVSTCLRAWAAAVHIAATPPAGVTIDHINSWVNDPKSERKSHTRELALCNLRQFFRFCSAKGWIVGDPSQLCRVNWKIMSHEQKERTPRSIFTEEEVNTLMANTKPGEFWHAAIAFGRHFGLRIGDICALEWETFSKPGKIVVWTDKQNTRVELPLTPQVVVDAIAAIPSNGTPYCFPVQREIANDPRRCSLMSHQFTRLAAKLGVTGKSFHCFRHTYATACLKAGIEPLKISLNLGHRDPRSTATYLHP